jgi:WD40 repeat protein/energy-coupling factor transporter ATP-binding protein EcfA2
VGTDDFVPENPYKGLRAFSSADHGEFFGREKVTQRLVGRMLESGEHSRFLAVVGPSGSGKSSLVKAGLIPAVWRGALPGSEKWFVVEMMPGALPLDELEVALIRVAHQASLGLREQLERDENGLARAAQLLLPSDGSELLLVIDQFEEVFTLVEDDATRRRFLDLLVAAVTATRSRVRVVITLRADFYDRPLQYARFGELLRRRQEIVLPLSAEELERAVVLPAQAVGVTFEQGLVSTIVSEVKYQPGALPLLQYALTELFERRQGRLLTQEAFREIGGVTGALASRAESLYEDGDATSREMIRQVFLRLVTLGEGTEDTRRRTLRSELLMLNASTDLVEDIIDTFARGRLLALDTDPSTREPTVEVAHEALLREWERLKGWLNASRDDIRQQRQLSALAAEWTEAKQDASYLVQGSRLGQLGAWAQHTDLTLTPQERLYLQMSMNERERQQLEDRARAVREEHLERRSQNFLRGLVGVFAVATVLSVGLTLVAFSQNQAAQAERARAEAAQAQSEERAAYASSVALASAARNALTLNNPDQALALALAANTVTDQPPGISRNALYDSAFVPATRWVLKEAGFDRIVNSPDGKHAFAMRDDNSAAVIDLITGEIVTQWTPEFMSAEDFICADGLLFAADGRTAFVEMVKRDFSGGAFIEFDIRTGAEVRRFTPAAGFPCHASYSADGQYIYVPTLVYQADTNILPGTIYQWSIASGDMIAEHVLDTSGLPTAVDIYLSVSADGRNAVGAFDTGHVLLWDLFTGERVHTILDEALRGRVWAVNLLPSGIVVVNDLYSRLATTVTLWDEVTGERISQHTWESNSADAQVSPDGRLLAISLQSANVALFDLVAWQPGITLHGHGYVTFRVEFTADLKHLVSVNADGTVRLWNLTSGNERQRLEGFSNIVSAFVISPDGTTAAIQEYSPGSPAQLGLWNLETGTLIRSVGVFVDSFRGIAFSPDGRTIAATSAYFDVGNTCSASSSAITLIDAATGERLWETALESVLVFGGITFSGNGSKVIGAAPECGDPLIILDAATGEVMETWEGHSAGVNFVTASHDGRWTASGSWDATAILWDAEGQSVHTLQHDAPVVVLAFSPDDRLLLTSSLDNRLHLWDVASGQRVKQLTGHTAGVWFVDFSPDGAYIVSSSQDFNVFIWDWQAGEVVRQFSVAQFGPAGTTAQFSPDGAAVYVQTADSGVVIHKYDLLLEPGALQAWISDNRYVRDLTCAERELYRIEPLCEDS